MKSDAPWPMVLARMIEVVLIQMDKAHAVAEEVAERTATPLVRLNDAEDRLIATDHGPRGRNGRLSFERVEYIAAGGVRQVSGQRVVRENDGSDNLESQGLAFIPRDVLVFGGSGGRRTTKGERRRGSMAEEKSPAALFAEWLRARDEFDELSAECGLRIRNVTRKDTPRSQALDPKTERNWTS